MLFLQEQGQKVAAFRYEGDEVLQFGVDGHGLLAFIDLAILGQGPAAFGQVDLTLGLAFLADGSKDCL